MCLEDYHIDYCCRTFSLIQKVLLGGVTCLASLFLFHDTFEFKKIKEISLKKSRIVTKSSDLGRTGKTRGLTQISAFFQVRPCPSYLHGETTQAQKHQMTGSNSK